MQLYFEIRLLQSWTKIGLTSIKLGVGSLDWAKRGPPMSCIGNWITSFVNFCQLSIEVLQNINDLKLNSVYRCLYRHLVMPSFQYWTKICPKSTRSCIGSLKWDKLGPVLYCIIVLFRFLRQNCELNLHGFIFMK